MAYFGLLFIEIAILFFLSKKISKELSKFMSINLLSFLFLPGVIIHELSHLLIAAILLVPVGRMEFSPKTSQGRVKLGSIEIAKTDPVRRAIIGFAPVLVGMAIILELIYFTFNNSMIQIIEPNGALITVVYLATFYLIFAISNTMFSSTKDMEGTIETIVTLLIIVLLLYFLDLRVPLSLVLGFLEDNIDLVKKSTAFLLAPIIIDLFILGAIKAFTGSRSQT
jgi:energy-coupling factor transporter transmembrane protein EcfT